MSVVNELLFYTGLVLTVLFFLLSLFIFFNQKIPSAVSYFLNIGQRKLKSKKSFEKTIAYKETLQEKKQLATKPNEELTYLLSDEETELLSKAQNYATALIEAECTTYLEKPEDDLESNY